MTHRPFFARLIVVFAVLLAVIVAVCGGVIYVAGQRAVRAQQTADLERLTPLVKQWLAEGGARPEGLAAVRGRLEDASRLLGTRISVIAPDGRVVVDTLVPLDQLDNHNDRPEVVAARAGQTGVSARPSRSLREESVYVAELADPANPAGTVIRLSYPHRSWAKLGVSGWQVVGGGVVAALLAVGALWLILQRRWIGPTHTLVAAAERMAAGDWAARVEPRGADELQFFSTRMNLVASHAQQQLADLRHQRADLQALVDTLPDPVLLTGPDGKVVLINLPAARLLDLARARALGQNVVNVVNDDAVLRLIERVGSDPPVESDPRRPTPAGWALRDNNGNGAEPRATGTSAQGHERTDVATALEPDPDGPPPLTREIRLNRDGQWLTYQAVAKRTAGGGVLLVLRDVTALASAVQMKTDFVANASHELRTPIAAIKIAFETLREVYADDATQTERCMQVIDGHLRRLEEMLRDLLDLSRVENPNLNPHVKRVKTNDVMAHVRSSLGPMARQKLVELVLGDAAGGGGRDPAAPTEFLGDERLLNLVLKNLVENSIKFTPAGGSVTVTLRRAERANADVPANADAPASGVAAADGEPAADGGLPTVLLTVRDTGIGIPPEHLDRVFERFYQVDAARSGSAGRGTGLGLAIVKHAIAALGGWVQVESTVGHGTTVTCALPQVEPAPEAEEVLA